MKRTLFLFLVPALIAGCAGSSDTLQTCTFTKTIIQRDSATWANLPGDTPHTYSYYTNMISMDSLLTALCEKGISIKEAWYCPNDAYLCRDAIGPRPVIILTKADTSMIGYGFVQGNNGRLACGMTLHNYKP